MITTVRDQLRGRIRYFLLLLIVIHFTYPLSEINETASALYVTFYSLAVGFGAYITSRSLLREVITGLMTLLTILTGLAWALTSNDQAINIALYLFYIVIIMNISLIIFTLWEFVFTAEKINRDILFGGVSLYLLIGNFFTPLYLLLNAVIRNLSASQLNGFEGMDAFGIHTYDPVNGITWQRMYYLSFTTLTTLGFGDVTPVNSFVEPFVLAEAVIGVLFLAIFMARLVALYEHIA